MRFENGPHANITGGQENSKNERIKKLREAIARAEDAHDENEVILLEEELRYAEMGRNDFSRERYILDKAYSNAQRRIKHHVLRDMRRLSNTKNDYWEYDGLRSRLFSEHPYEETFYPLFPGFKISDFPSFIERKNKILGRDIKILDLFGGAYFLRDLSGVSRIVGVRIKNIDSEVLHNTPSLPFIRSQRKEDLKELIKSPKRRIIEGDLYAGKTWREIDKDCKENNGEKFDLIICRPQGPFGRGDGSITNIPDMGISREEIYASLLDRSLRLLSPEGGTLFSQVPELGTDKKVTEIFWRTYTEKKQREGFKFVFPKEVRMRELEIFAVVYNGKSEPEATA